MSYEKLDEMLKSLLQDQLYASKEIRYPARYQFYQNAIDFLYANNIQGDYYEFGCHKAITFRMCLIEVAKSGLQGMNFYAFDSFEGLPEAEGIDSGDVFARGALKTSIETFREKVEALGLFSDRINLVKGFYNDTLTAELQSELMQKSKASLVMVDCDFYESTVPVLQFIEPLLQEGTIILLDDFYVFKGNPNKGEQKAFAEFIQSSKYDFIPHLNVGWAGKSFITVPK